MFKLATRRRGFWTFPLYQGLVFSGLVLVQARASFRQNASLPHKATLTHVNGNTVGLEGLIPGIPPPQSPTSKYTGHRVSYLSDIMSAYNPSHPAIYLLYI